MKDYFKYAGKVCVVTGASNGMGKALTEMLVDMGAEVYALSRSEVKVEGIKKFVQVQLGEKNSIDAAFTQVPDKIDCFFGIAGVSGMKNDFCSTIEVNFIANKYITETYLKDRMNENGSIVYCSSTGGLRWEKPENMAEIEALVKADGWEDSVAAIEAMDAKFIPGPLAYIVAKRALLMYAATVVKEFGVTKKVRVNCTLPASTQSGMTGEFIAMKGGEDKFLESTGWSGRISTSEEQANAMAFLGSDMASYISGVMLCVDCGQDIEMIAGFEPDKYGFQMMPMFDNIKKMAAARAQQ